MMTSVSRFMENFLETCSWACSIRPLMSSDVAWFTFRIKFACLSEIMAPPRMVFLMPQASIKRPAPLGEFSGFLKTDPQVGLSRGCLKPR